MKTANEFKQSANADSLAWSFRTDADWEAVATLDQVLTETYAGSLTAPDPYTLKLILDMGSRPFAPKAESHPFNLSIRFSWDGTGEDDLAEAIADLAETLEFIAECMHRFILLDPLEGWLTTTTPAPAEYDDADWQAVIDTARASIRLTADKLASYAACLGIIETHLSGPQRAVAKRRILGAGEQETADEFGLSQQETHDLWQGAVDFIVAELKAA